MPQVIPVLAFMVAKSAGLGALGTGFLVGSASVVAGAFQADRARRAAKRSTTVESRGRQHIIRSSIEPHQIVVGEVPVSGPLAFADVTGSQDQYLHLVVLLAGHESEAIGEIYLDDQPLTGSKQKPYVRINKHLGSPDQLADADLVAESNLWTDNHRLREITYLSVRLEWPDNGYEIWPTGIPNIKAMTKGAKFYDPRSAGTAWSDNMAVAVRGYLKGPWGMACDDSEINDALMIADANICDEVIDTGPLADLTSIAQDWQFKSDNNGFTVAYATLSTGGEYSTLTALSADPQLRSEFGIAVAGGSNRFIRLLIRRVVGSVWDGRVFYNTVNHGFASTYYKVIPEIPIDGEFHFIELDMWDLTAGGDEWQTNEIRQVRFDFCGDTGAIVEIQYITVGMRETQKRYTCNGTFTLDQSPPEIIKGLLSAGVGSLCYSQGEYKLTVGAYTGAEADGLSESELRGPLKVRPRPPRAELFNSVRGLFVSPLDNYQPTDFPAVENQLYVDQDGGEQIWADLDLPFTTDPIAAQRIAKIHLERARQGIIVEYPGKLHCMRYKPGDVIPLSIADMGWVDKEFRVEDYVETADLAGVNLVLQEEAAESYDWNHGEATKYDPAPDTGLPDPGVCLPPSSLMVVSGDDQLGVAGDGTVISSMLVTWSAPLSGFITGYKVEFQKVGDTAWAQVPSTDLSALIGPVTDGERYNLRVFARNGLGVESEPAYFWNHTVVGKVTPPPAVSSFVVSRQADGTREFSADYPNKPKDFAGYRIYSKLGTGQVLPDMDLLNTDGLITAFPFESNQLAAGSYTFAITAVDTSGLESAAIYIETALADPRIGSVAYSEYPEADGWPGIKTDCFVDNNGWLEAISDMTWDTAPASWDAWTAWNEGARSPIIYEHPDIDLGFDLTFTPLISMLGDGTPTIEIQWMADGGSYSNWITPQPITARYLRVRVTVAGTAPLIKKLPILLSAAVITEEINDLDTSTLTGSYRIAAGDIRLPITKPFNQITQVQLALQSVGAGWTWEIVDKDTTVGPRIRIYNSSGVLADASIDAFIRGL